MIALFFLSSGSLTGSLIGGASGSAPVANNISSHSSLLSSGIYVVHFNLHGMEKMYIMITTIYINNLINSISSACITQNFTLLFT